MRKQNYYVVESLCCGKWEPEADLFTRRKYALDVKRDMDSDNPQEKHRVVRYVRGNTGRIPPAQADEPWRKLLPKKLKTELMGMRVWLRQSGRSETYLKVLSELLRRARN